LKLGKPEAEELLYSEARLLDDRRLEEWLEAFTGDGIYWLPLEENKDPAQFPSLVYEDHRVRLQRVDLLRQKDHFAQLPPSRTVHNITNVTVTDDGDRGGEAVVHCNLTLYELRPGHERQPGLGKQRVLAGRCEYRFRHEGRWLIALKKVLLLNRDLPMENLSFIV